MQNKILKKLICVSWDFNSYLGSSNMSKIMCFKTKRIKSCKTKKHKNVGNF